MLTFIKGKWAVKNMEACHLWLTGCSLSTPEPVNELERMIFVRKTLSEKGQCLAVYILPFYCSICNLYMSIYTGASFQLMDVTRMQEVHRS